MDEKAQYWIETLHLSAHPEGGWFREIYKSDRSFPFTFYPDKGVVNRNLSTAIYYLLSGKDFSAFHRLKADELWHYYDGNSALEIDIIHPDGELTSLWLGRNPGKGEFPVHIVPANTWFAANLVEPSGYILAGCTVSPGFRFDDFEPGDAAVLTDLYPQHKDIIEKLTVKRPRQGG
ncbi:MAG: cupin domain-containing protein [Bacteroidetes bacterium]|nr:cupin domain-containing protein [Bacteroidota bacterium]